MSKQYLAIMSAVPIAVMVTVYFLTAATWCHRGHPLEVSALEFHDEVLPYLQSDLLDENLRLLYQDVITGDIIGEEIAVYSAALKQCSTKQTGPRGTAYTFTLIQALHPDVYDDGYLHRPIMTVVVCSECQQVFFASIQEYRL